MRRSFAHEALLVTSDDADAGAPGAAVTKLLCGSWQHEGPCPLAPHHTQATRDAPHLRVRVLFAVEPELESTVRQRIVEALSGGSLSRGPGDSTGWKLVHSEASDVTASEAAHATRLAQAP